MRTPHQILNGVSAAFFTAGSGLGGAQAEKQAVQLPVVYWGLLGLRLQPAQQLVRSLYLSCTTPEEFHIAIR